MNYTLTKNSDSDADNIYYDLLISNIESNSPNQIPILNFTDSRNDTLINKADDYEFSIIRFYLNTNSFSIPSFIPVVNNSDGNTDINQTIYKFQISYVDGSGNLISVNRNITYAPQVYGVPIPSGFAQNGYNNNDDGYYNIYCNEYFITLVNNQITTAFNEFLLLLDANGVLTYNQDNVKYSPKFTLNGELFTYSCGAPFFNFFNTSYYNPLIVPFPCFFSMNNSMYNLFSDLNFVYNATYNGVTLPNYYTLLVGNYFQEASIGPSILTLTQSTPSINLWTPIESILFVSNLLPIKSNYLSKPLVYSKGNILPSLNGNNSNFSKIITDITVGDNYKNYILYNPTAQYRFISLIGSDQIKNIDIQVLYKDRTGRTSQIFLSSGGSMSMKLYFRKKKTNKYLK
jgi:hypothetical protein